MMTNSKTDDSGKKISDTSVSIVYYHPTRITLIEFDENSIENDWLKMIERPDTPPELVAWARSWHVLKNRADLKSNEQGVKKAGQPLKRFSKPKRFTLRQVQNSLIADEKPYFDKSNGSPVAELISEIDLVQITDSQLNWSENITSDCLLKFPLFGKDQYGKMQYSISTNYTEIVLEPLEKPMWAEGIGRDHLGLFVIITEAGVKTKLHWFIPGTYSFTSPSEDDGQFSINRLQSSVSTSDNNHDILQLNEGFWWHADEFRNWLHNGFTKPEWAESAGIDSFGLYADLKIDKITQRMRWIKPGSFLMGTSEEEAVRNDDEDQHLVILTKGYWLADTACTQEFWNWLSVTNPSCFQHKNKPVDGVSLVECLNFINKLNEIRPDIMLRLPSEAEWEYACRAGTTTPYNFGNTINPDQVNYDNRELSAGGGIEQYRNETIEVKSLPCNKWGLYEMHGNVWEWCSDFYGNYPKNVSINPHGPDSGDSHILRGGAWNIGSRFTRSAYRLLNRPSISNNNHGFRLVIS